MKLETWAQGTKTYVVINFEPYETISVWDIAIWESKIVSVSPTQTIVTMKLGNNAQSATSYILVNFDLNKAISTRNIELGSYAFQKFTKTPFLEKSAFFISLSSTSLPLLHSAEIWPQSEHQVQNTRCPKFSTKPDIVSKRHRRISSVFAKVFAIDIPANF